MNNGHDNGFKRALILEGAVAFAALAAGAAFFGYSGETQPTPPPAAVVSSQPAPVQPAVSSAPEKLPETPPVEAPAEPLPEPEIKEEIGGRKEYVARKAVYLSIDRVLDKTALTIAQNAGADTIIINMKHDSGNLNWVSEQEIALKLGLSSRRSEISESLREFLANDSFHTVARVSAFRDRLVGTEREYSVMNNRNNYWTDEKGLFWTAVGNPDIRSYIVGCVNELVELGFDEVMIENLAPDGGRLDVMLPEQRFDGDSEQALIDSLNEIVGKTDVYLSVKTGKAALTAAEPLNSLTAEMVKNGFDYCWENVDGVLHTVPTEEFCKAE